MKHKVLSFIILTCFSTHIVANGVCRGNAGRAVKAAKSSRGPDNLIVKGDTAILHERVPGEGTTARSIRRSASYYDNMPSRAHAVNAADSDAQVQGVLRLPILRRPSRESVDSNYRSFASASQESGGFEGFILEKVRGFTGKPIYNHEDLIRYIYDEDLNRGLTDSQTIRLGKADELIRNPPKGPISTLSSEI